MSTMSEPAMWMGMKSCPPSYGYRAFPIKHQHEEIPANYIFAKQTPGATGQWTALYIGQTDNLAERMKSSYEGHECAIAEGATHVHVHIHAVDDETARRDEEADLIARYQPPCNKQGKG